MVIINMNHEITSLFIYRHLTVSERMVELLCDLKVPWSTDGGDNNPDKNEFTCCEYYSFGG